MKKIFTLSFAFAAMLAGSTAAWADDYPTTYSASDYSNRSDRYTKSLTVTADGEETTISLVSAGFGPLYIDKTDKEITATAGSNVKISADFVGAWMHAYAYVDMDNDGQFSYDVDATNHTALSTSDLRTFSFYSFGSSDESGYNSEGTAITGEARSTWEMPAFTAPTTAGTYRVRFKMDWDNIDPAGSSTLKANGGVIVDFTLKVVDGTSSAGESVPYSINFAESQTGWTAIDQSETPGTTWAYSKNGFYDDGNYYAGVAMTPDYSSTYNDYYVSPAISLKAGKTYEVKTLAFAGGSNATVKLLRGTSATDMTTMSEIATLNTPSIYDSSAEETNKVTVSADGEYYFAFLGTTADIYTPQYAYLMSFRIDEEGSTEPTEEEYTIPYSVNFGDYHDGWTAVDNNGDNYTWERQGGVGMAIDYSVVDDEYVSPSFSLEAGKSYLITTKVQGASVNENAQLSLLAGTSQGSLSTINGSMTVPTTGEQVEETTFSPSESGKYCFALKEVIVDGEDDPYTMPLYLISFAIEEKEETVEDDVPVFTADFTGSNPADGWYISDANSDNVTWASDTATPGITYSSDKAQAESSDWLATPYFEVVSGHDYIVDLTFAQSGAFDPDKVSISWGKAAWLDASATSVAEEEIYAENGQGSVSKSYRVTAGFSGNAYVAVYAQIPASNGTLSLTSLKVTPVAKAVPMDVTNLSGKVDSQKAQVTLTWTNPSTDTKNIPISGTLKANIYESGELVATTDALTPGEEVTYTFSATSFGSETTYVVKAAIGEKEAEGASVTVDLQDVQGKETLVKDFDVTKYNAYAWAIENIAGTSEWAYDYSNVFRFNYQSGQKTDNDWLISPAVELEKGVRYIARYQLKTSRDYAANVDVTVGNDQSSSAQTQVIASHPSLMQNGFGDFESKQFNVSETGNYYIGFHVFNSDYAVSMCNLKIYRIDITTAIENVEADASLSYDARTATLNVPAGTVNVYDVQGRLALRTSSSNGTLSLGSLPAGIYVVKTASQSIKIAK